MFGRKKMSSKQRQKLLTKLRKEVSELKEDEKLKAQVKEERKEIKSLMAQLHPSKVRRLAQLLAKGEHGAVAAGHAFGKAHQQIHKARLEFEKEVEKVPPGLIRYKKTRK